MAPATLVVYLVVAGLALGGVLLVVSAFRAAAPARVCPAPSCGYRNPAEAQYCARCGTRLW